MHSRLALVIGVLTAVSGVTAGAQKQSASAVVPHTQTRLAALRPLLRANQLATVQGSALTSTSGQLPNTMVRLRDARYGRVVDSQFTDNKGAFIFRAVDPGNYLVEIVSTNQTSIATTQLLSANAGETVTAVVKLPLKPSLFATVLGQQSGAATTPVTVTGSVTDAIPTVVQQLPQTAVQSLPAVVPTGDPVSPR